MLIANVDYDDFKGKMGIGRVLNGELNAGDQVAYGKPGEPFKSAKIAELYVFNNVGREKVETASAGVYRLDFSIINSVYAVVSRLLRNISSLSVSFILYPILTK